MKFGKKAVVLLSGGLDSVTTLYWAKDKGYDCYCITFDYGQKHKKEVYAARKIANKANCKYRLVKINLPPFVKSSLITKTISIPKNRDLRRKEIPSTYVPARNTIFLSFATAFAESIGANFIFVGANICDYSGYPDCQPEYYKAFEKVIKLGTKKKDIRILAPLIRKKKSDIVKLALRLHVPLELTWSCYEGKKYPCGRCDSCRFRAKGFKEAGIKDPLISS